MNSKNNLIIAAVGDNSYHKTWLQGANKEFDVMLVYFDKISNKYKEDADYYLQTSGLFKLENIYSAVQNFSEEIKKYDAVCLPDDDIIMNADQLNNLFRIFHQHELNIGHPAVSGGVFNLPILKKRDRFILRYANWADMMCPIFKASDLLSLQNTLRLNRSGWGADMVWSNFFNYQKIAIIDEVGIFHGSKTWIDRPEREYYLRLKNQGVNFINETKKLVKDHDLLEKKIQYRKIKKEGANIISCHLEFLRREWSFFNYRFIGEIKKIGPISFIKKYCLRAFEFLMGLAGIFLKSIMPKLYYSLKK